MPFPEMAEEDGKCRDSDVSWGGGIMGSQKAAQSSPGDTWDAGKGGERMWHRRAVAREAPVAALGAW